MYGRKIIEGEKFNDLTILMALPEMGKNPRYVECKCDCGKIFITRFNYAYGGHAKSCGCRKKTPPNTSHRESGKSIEYATWSRMLSRCYNKNVAMYYRYGARGISVCEEWRNSYEQFLLDMGRRPNGKYSLDRIDNNKGYSKENCRWATDIEQANNKCNNTMVEYYCGYKTITELSRIYKTNTTTMRERLIKCNYDINTLNEKYYSHFLSPQVC